jgi:hypothetical protein
MSDLLIPEDPSKSDIIKSDISDKQIQLWLKNQ